MDKSHSFIISIGRVIVLLNSLEMATCYVQGGPWASHVTDFSEFGSFDGAQTPLMVFRVFHSI